MLLVLLGLCHSPSGLTLFFFTSFGDDILLEELGRDDSEALVATAAIVDVMRCGDVVLSALADDDVFRWFDFLNNPSSLHSASSLCEY